MISRSREEAGRPCGGRLSTAIIVAVVMMFAGALEWLNGRSLFCRCGMVRLWTGRVKGPENSQQLADWYSLSHVVHGLVLYAATRVAMPRRTLCIRMLAATVIEAAWEVVENSAYIIDRYRAETVSWGYTGDSILNSAGDILFMLVGFAAAARLRASFSVMLGLMLELIALVAIRDNLTLNVLMLIHPLASVRAWQAG